MKLLPRKADNTGMIWSGLFRVQLSRITLLMLPLICCGWQQLHAGESPGEPELLLGRRSTHCEVIERRATDTDVPLTSRVPVLSEPRNWLSVPGPHGERAEGWQGRRPGYRVFDSRGRVLQVLSDVSLPRWSPDGRWLAVDRWSRDLPYELALVEVGTGKVILIPKVQYLDQCAWSPDSRKLAFVGRLFPSGDHLSAGWLSVSDTSAHMVARGLNRAFECIEMAWSEDSRRFVALMQRENEHDDVRVTDLWLFGLAPGACRLTATPRVEESSVSWLDDRRVIFRTDPSGSDTTKSDFGTVLELPTLAKSKR